MLATRTVTTTGQGSVPVARDAVLIEVSATHAAPTLSGALAGAESARAAVVEVARRHVDGAATSTQGLSTWPRQDADGGRTEFEARHSLRIRCAGLEAGAALLQALADEVGDRLSVDAVTLTASPDDEHRAVAREAAFADARARAEHLATLAGSSLGAVVSVVEGGAVGGGGRVGRVALAAKSDVGFEGGTDEVAASVTVTWEIG